MNDFVQMFKLVNKIPRMDHHMTENELNPDAQIQDVAAYVMEQAEAGW